MECKWLMLLKHLRDIHLESNWDNNMELRYVTLIEYQVRRFMINLMYIHWEIQR